MSLQILNYCDNNFVVLAETEENAQVVSRKANLDDVKTTILEILIPEKCMDVNELYHQYKKYAGEEWPFRQFGFKRSYDFLLSMPDTVEVSIL